VCRLLRFRLGCLLAILRRRLVGWRGGGVRILGIGWCRRSSVFGEDFGSLFVSEPSVLAVCGLDDFCEVVFWASCDEDGRPIVREQALALHANWRG